VFVYFILVVLDSDFVSGRLVDESFIRGRLVLFMLGGRCFVGGVFFWRQLLLLGSMVVVDSSCLLFWVV